MNGKDARVRRVAPAVPRTSEQPSRLVAPRTIHSMAGASETIMALALVCCSGYPARDPTRRAPGHFSTRPKATLLIFPTLSWSQPHRDARSPHRFPHRRPHRSLPPFHVRHPSHPRPQNPPRRRPRRHRPPPRTPPRFPRLLRQNRPHRRRRTPHRPLRTHRHHPHQRLRPPRRHRPRPPARQLPPHTPIKAIALSGYGTDDDIRKSRDAGFHEHLVKPFHFPDLESTLDRLTHTR